MKHTYTYEQLNLNQSLSKHTSIRTELGSDFGVNTTPYIPRHKTTHPLKLLVKHLTGPIVWPILNKHKLSKHTVLNHKPWITLILNFPLYAQNAENCNSFKTAQRVHYFTDWRNCSGWENLFWKERTHFTSEMKSPLSDHKTFWCGN